MSKINEGKIEIKSKKKKKKKDEVFALDSLGEKKKGDGRGESALRARVESSLRSSIVERLYT